MRACCWISARILEPREPLTVTGGTPAPPPDSPGGEEMTVTGLAYALSAVVGVGIVVIGARFLLAPRAAAAGYGLPAGPEPGSAGPLPGRQGRPGYHQRAVCAHPDRRPRPHVLGWLMLAATLIPISDSVIVIRHHGSKATAYAKARGRDGIRSVIRAGTYRGE
jgi:hypothetical protein